MHISTAILAGTLLAASSPGVRAQDAYHQGYNNGYNDHPPTSVPMPGNDYSRGFQQGRDDADDDDMIEQKRLQSQQRSDALMNDWANHPGMTAPLLPPPPVTPYPDTRIEPPGGMTPETEAPPGSDPD